ncbi:unnamed protein product [Blepharisma stoltei]|uniref:CLASP N-terminal domain-containing protein n=1 Tax=Blepharisma stoltei TaxID=1481888 RepID=A0AAU9JGX5_9CILI|nr:unnamed protein product [Blepharisma stoltei]
MEQQGEVGLDYTPFEALEESNQDIGVVLYLLHSENWKENFIGIDQLRAINKYRWLEFLDYWPRVSDRVMELMDSIRSSLSKNTLLLLSECFAEPRENSEMVAQCVATLLLTKTVNEKSFIRGEAVTALTNICATVTSEEIARQLLEGCFHKSGQIADIAYQHLATILPRLYPNTVLHITLRLLDSKRQKTLTGSKECLKHLSENWPDFSQAVSALAASEQEKVRQALQQKAKRAGGLREMIQKSKKENVQPTFILEE